MPFVTHSRPVDEPASPEALFRLLRPADPNVRDLLLRQGDALRQYADLETAEPNVAIDLPTGGGKTLVGLLIAEWRRRKLGQRVAYLCPTTQLVRQVASKATAYGLDVVTIAGGRKTWTHEQEAGFLRFQRGQAVVVAPYHHVFNSNPHLNSAQTLILDDAHAAEDAVASNWSLRASRGTELYTALTGLVRPYIPESLSSQIDDPGADPTQRGQVALVPPQAAWRLAGEIRRVLSDYATDGPESYTKNVIGSAVGQCLIYVSWGQVLIRPLVVPTSTHPAFSDAEQRVYMSATLGVAGELERAFGVRSIKRIALPTDETFGRRFFVMPSALKDSADPIITQAINNAGRAVLLTPSTAQLDEAASSLIPDGFARISAADVEETFDPFVASSQAVLTLANRYDGIDLPGDSCRLVIMSGLPAHAHLQEQFFMDALGARRVLSERIRTRIQQGAGRATRSQRDFAAVIVRGGQLTDFLTRAEETRAMPPQLQAEIEFGFRNSEEPGTDALTLLDSFWNQDAEWQGAERYVIEDTAARQRDVDDIDTVLASVAPTEVACWEAAFAGDLAGAIAAAQVITDRLSGGAELRPYRAFWFYLASSWAYCLARQSPEQWTSHALTLESEARGCAETLSWKPYWPTDEQSTPPDRSDPTRAERAGQTLRKLGIRGTRFNTHIDQLWATINSDTASPFEEGLRQLGELLGFDARRPSGTADPDGVWADGTRVWLLFEAKTEAKASTPLSAAYVRQALTHPDWVHNVMGLPDPGQKITTVVTTKTTIDPSAVPIAGDLRICDPSVLRDIAQRTIEAIKHVRAAARGQTDDELHQRIELEFLARHLTTAELADQLGARRVIDG